jgi:hypothetical protein
MQESILVPRSSRSGAGRANFSDAQPVSVLRVARPQLAAARRNARYQGGTDCSWREDMDGWLL